MILVMVRGGATDLAAQEAALNAINLAFVLAKPGGARLLLAGPAVIARDAARSIRSDVDRIAVVSTILVLALLGSRFRSSSCSPRLPCRCCSPWRSGSG